MAVIYYSTRVGCIVRSNKAMADILGPDFTVLIDIFQLMWSPSRIMVLLWFVRPTFLRSEGSALS